MRRVVILMLGPNVLVGTMVIAERFLGSTLSVRIAFFNAPGASLVSSLALGMLWDPTPRMCWSPAIPPCVRQDKITNTAAVAFFEC
ncbi:hypothetical protein EDB81DRAFT_773325 [Dactylonectria macrodidyma]|uniref:Uncharacterized protein n=1 Tax=Dactylonectria macrodidyma TaxID=307937 RepID=A0A9P9JNE1_9HYPO|nr:hypothetical protein EDB81DRAFT_773325 [Dactylonectria macrodidyma]